MNFDYIIRLEKRVADEYDRLEECEDPEQAKLIEKRLDELEEQLSRERNAMVNSL